MSCDYHHLPHAGIRTLVPYKPGKSIEELAQERGLLDIIKLASNENPLGCSPLVKQALNNLSPLQLATYPIASVHPLYKKLSEKLKLPRHQLILTHGSDALFSLLLTTFALHNNKQVITHEYAFSTYAIQAQTLGIPVLTIPDKRNWEVDLDAISAACNDQTALIFLANPNNPTGLSIPLAGISKLLTQIPESTLLVMDEAYYEFAYPLGDQSSLKLLQHYPNLVITRTFSKMYGLAGLRLGYGMAHPEIIELLQRVQLPFMVNIAALTAALAAIEDETFVKQTLISNTTGKQQLYSGLTALQLSPLPSSTNFITFDCQGNALAIYEALEQHGIIVRPLNPYGLSNHLRVTIGTTLQNSRFLDTLALCLKMRKA